MVECQKPNFVCDQICQLCFGIQEIPGGCTQNVNQEEYKEGEDASLATSHPLRLIGCCVCSLLILFNALNADPRSTAASLRYTTFTQILKVTHGPCVSSPSACAFADNRTHSTPRPLSPSIPFPSPLPSSSFDAVCAGGWCREIARRSIQARRHMVLYY